jgi:hypothetical protein
MRPTPLTFSQILHWADAFHRRHRRWPTSRDGPIPSTADATWRRIDSALRLGLRGLPGGSSLAQLLADERGVRKPGYLPPLTVQQILSWADSHRRRTGRWPTMESGPIAETPGETWRRIDSDLRLGLRKLPGGSSLAQLLARRRGARNSQGRPPLSVRQVLIWADAHHRRTGRWPTNDAGDIPEARGETWGAVQAALQRGRRGFPGGDTLPRLLARERGVPNTKDPPLLDITEIFRWAAAYHRRTGEWHTAESGPIPKAPGQTWSMVNRALVNGKRGLPGRTSLFQLLQQRSGSPEES